MVAKQPAARKKAAKKTVAKKKVVKKKASKKVPTRRKPVDSIQRSQDRKKTPKRGGYRKGAGRKAAATTSKARQIADDLVESKEITPLEYMLGVLRETPEKIKEKHKSGELDEAEYILALKEAMDRRDWAAEKAAPYIHPRLASIESNVTVKGQDFWQRELAREDAEEA